MLKKYSFKVIYDSSNDNIAKDFIEPSLMNSQIYKRGVGYFTSGWLSYNAHGLAFFVSNGGVIQFITSPILDENDVKALQGQYDKTSIINKAILKNIDELEEKLKDETRNLLGWLVYDEILEFKFAIPQNHLAGGEFHDKFGIFIDEENNMVSFNGSMNETTKGFLNYESITVFYSWKDDTSYSVCKNNLERFNRLWNNEDPNIFVCKINEIIKRRMIQFRTTSKRPYSLKINTSSNNIKKSENKPNIPSWLNIRDYQKEAFQEWKKNNFRGILSMATGTGKTITAFYSLLQLLNSKEKLVTIIVVPYQHLLTQWSNEAKKFNIQFIECFESSKKWSSELLNAITKYKYNIINHLYIVTTNFTYISKKFQDSVTKLDELCLIVDEVHNFGAQKIQKFYLENAKYRLGLSATPERYMDNEGTNIIKKYFGNIIFEFSLEKAIKTGMLTPYKYYPVLVYLTEEEQNQYIDLTNKISKLMFYDEITNEETIKRLAIKRAKIISGAKNKTPKLKDTILNNNLVYSKYNLFYCAAKTIYEEDNALRMVDEVYHMLLDIGINVAKFTSMDSASKMERNSLITKLEKGIIDGLVAIKCLDEGVDIPVVRRAFILSSSNNPKEFIQRRGRVLRKAEGKEFAEIYDFLVVPSSYKNKEEFLANQKYLEKELIRYREFAKLALNYPECEKSLLHIAKEYHLLYI